MNDVDWTRGAWVCGGWLLGDSVLGTWAICLQTARPFAYFRLPASMAAVVVEVALVRSLAPCFVATAAWFGVCSATRAGTKFPYLAFLAAVALLPRTWLARSKRGTRIFVTWCLGGVALGLVRVAFSLIRGATG